MASSPSIAADGQLVDDIGAVVPVGYSVGRSTGGTVTQATSRATGVTLSKLTGQITLNNTSLAALAAATFTVTNTRVAAGDIVVVNITGATNKATTCSVTAVAAGSFEITIVNGHATVAEIAAATVNFAVIKGSSN